MSKNQLVAVGNFSVEEVETMRLTLAKDASSEQFTLFVRTAAAAGLNPFLNHIYCIVYGGKMSIQISVEGIMFLAKRVEGYEGIDVQLVYENDIFKPKRVRDDQGRFYWDVEHEIADDPGKVKGCYAFAYRTGFPPVFEYMKVDEVQHHLSGNNAANWKKYFNDFFKKTVVKRAAKRQYGIEVAEDDTPETGGSIPAYQQPERRDITTEAEQMAKEEQRTSKPESSVNNDETKLQEARQQMAVKFQALGITDPEEMGKYIAQHAKPKGKKPTLAEMMGLLKIMDMHIEEKNAADADNSSADLLDDELMAAFE
ncbi:RecT family recombinase [Paenibacillus elgii]|uniref:RecT family recombinase n=1 Tax=Paenibacillus elgii TaxID=189691 RepID=UPI000248C955|nr:RecT family recombinase [Paenibacillus elgii]